MRINHRHGSPPVTRHSSVTDCTGQSEQVSRRVSYRARPIIGRASRDRLKSRLWRHAVPATTGLPAAIPSGPNDYESEQYLHTMCRGAVRAVAWPRRFRLARLTSARKSIWCSKRRKVLGINTAMIAGKNRFYPSTFLRSDDLGPLPDKRWPSIVPTRNKNAAFGLKTSWLDRFHE